MASRSKAKQLELSTQLARIARDNIALFVPIRTYGRLKESFRYIVTRNKITIYSIYYWARWVNDGRGPVEAAPGKYLLYYFDPADDPRIKESYPRKPSQVRHLTEKEMDDPNLVFAKRVGPAEGLGFIEDGIRKSRAEIAGSALRQIKGDIRKLISRGTNKITVSI